MLISACSCNVKAIASDVCKSNDCSVARTVATLRNSYEKCGTFTIDTYTVISLRYRTYKYTLYPFVRALPASKQVLISEPVLR